MIDLKFLFEKPTVPFRGVNRKGTLRYIASERRGSLGAITRFAPPTKPMPRLCLGLLGWVDFRVSGAINSIGVSEKFLVQVADRLGIPVERIGIYVGEPNERQKLVIIDVVGESPWVLKMSVGREADAAIRREAKVLLRKQDAVSDELRAKCCQLNAISYQLGAPEVRRIDPVCGHDAILIERVSGKQLTSKEFEGIFFAAGIEHKIHEGTEGAKHVTVEEWLDQSLGPGGQNLEPLLAACREKGAFELTSPSGLVHGDFAPWNIVRRTISDKRPQRSGGSNSQTTDNSSVINTHSHLCAIDWEFSRDDTPLIFDVAYACWCYAELLGRRMAGIDDKLWTQLVSLGALWQELRQQL